MSDDNVDIFLNTPGIKTVEPITIGESLEGGNNLIPLQNANPVVDDSIMEINNEERLGGLEDNAFEFFNNDNVESINEFIIYHDIFNYEDSRYDHAYMSRFDEDSFF